MFPDKDEKIYDGKRKKKMSFICSLVSALGLPSNSDREKDMILKSMNEISAFVRKDLMCCKLCKGYIATKFG